MMLLAAIEAYVRLKQSLGAVFSADRRILRSFGRHLGDLPVDAISAEACLAFCQGAGPATRFGERKHQTLRGFFAYLRARGHMPVSPLREPGPRVGRSFRPYIYSRDEILRLLAATAILADSRWPQQAQTFRTMLLLLYGAGLRAGEALRLRCCDVDLHARVLTIWDTKFFKSRHVPLGADLCAALKAYRRQRETRPCPSAEQSAFFASHTGHSISLGRLQKVFRRLRTHAEIRRPATDRWQPRLHDLRHYPARRIIPHGRMQCVPNRGSPAPSEDSTRDNQSFSRKARSASSGRKRPGLSPEGDVRARACSLRRMSACK
jgi:site-specific recombinase XerD